MPYFFPTPEHNKLGEEVTRDMVEQLELGTTTRNDVRLLLGEPTYISGNLWSGNIWCYGWTRTIGYWGFVGDGYSNHSLEAIHKFCLEFMPDDRLKRFKHFNSRNLDKRKGNIYQQIEDWENEED